MKSMTKEVAPTCLVIGDIMLDIYLYGKVERISPEAPIPVVQITKEQKALGGAANVAANISGLGIQTFLCGIIGNDENGENILKTLQEKKISFCGCIFKNITTTTKTRVVGRAQQIVRFDNEDIDSITDSYEEELLKHIEIQLPHVDVIILSDYNKGVCGVSFLKKVIAMAKSKDILIITDPKSPDWTRYERSNWITPNMKEFCEALGKNIPNDEAVIREEGQKLIRKFHIPNILVTRSEHGMTLVQNDYSITYSAEAQEVYDVSGAGDTVVAMLASCLGSGRNAQDAVQLANYAAGIAVSKVGTYIVSQKDIKDFFLCKQSTCKKKIYTTEQLCKQLETWSIQKKRIVFTNGCFDILHAGHIHYLEQAKALGDLLIVGVNTDRSVKALKGTSRPINNEADRAYLLSALEPIDAVVLFDEDTPYELIRLIRPDILVKGGDYKTDQIVGREFAKETRTIDFVEGHSTTNLIENIRNI